MSLYGSLYTAISGLSVNGMAMSVIGDNIANMNTIGYKRARANFQDMMAFPVIGIGTESLIGRGATLQGVSQEMTQGSFVNTGNGLDLAIQGEGFFAVKGTVSGQSSLFYSRAGQFHVDKDGYMVNAAGLKLQGYMADAAGNVSTSVSDLYFKNAASPANATKAVDLFANLDSGATAIPGGFNAGTPFTDTAAEATSNFNTSITVYDSLGAARDIRVYFTKTAAGQWSWNAVVSGKDSASGNTEVQASGTLSFDTDGKLVSTTPSPTTGSFNFANATANQSVSLNFGDPTSGGGTGLAGMTQFSGNSAVTYQSQDGNPPGDLQTVVIDDAGMITGSFSNGQKRRMGQVALANFQGQGLKRMGGNLWQESTESGKATIGAANTGSRGSISSSVLEQANVDLSQEFVDMIVAQRAYQANSRTVTTADSLMQEALNMKR